MASICELKNKILAKLDTSKEWGVLCNQVQDVAEEHLSNHAFGQYIRKASRDLRECEGSDFLVMNGHYWDWREFDSNTVPIVLAFLDYFDLDSLTIIEQNLL